MKEFFEHIEWKDDWFPEWFKKIDRALEKIQLPKAGARLEYLLDQNYHRELHKAGVKSQPTREIQAFYAPSSTCKDDKGNEFVWGRVLQRDDKGKPICMVPSNEFFKYEVFTNLCEFLDYQLLRNYYNGNILGEAFKKAHGIEQKIS